MVKNDLVDEMVNAFPGITKKDMFSVMDVLFESMAQSMIRGEPIDLRGFGRFKVKKRQPMRGRNPRTGMSVDVPARWVTHFKPAVGLADRIKHGVAEVGGAAMKT